MSSRPAPARTRGERSREGAKTTGTRSRRLLAVGLIVLCLTTGTRVPPFPPPSRAELAALVARQARDGHWEGSDRGEEVRATAMALLTLLRAGGTTCQEPYMISLARGLNWLASRQGLSDPGRFGDGRGSDHAIATVAFCVAYASSRSPAQEYHAQMAVDWIVRTRDPALAGTGRDAGRRREDLALAAARRIGLGVDVRGIDDADPDIDRPLEWSSLFRPPPGPARNGEDETGGPCCLPTCDPDADCEPLDPPRP